MSEPIETEEIRELLVSLGAPADIDVTDDMDAASYASDLVFARDDTLSLAELAARSNRTPDEVRSVLAPLGIRIGDDDEVMFSENDAELVKMLQVATDSLLTDEEGTELLRVASVSITTLAEAAVATHVQGTEARTPRGFDHVQNNVIMTQLGLEVGRVFGHILRHHLRQAALRQRATQSKDRREIVTQGIGFVDLVGFTSFSQSGDTADLIALVAEFETNAHSLAADHDARIVKLIGDEVMFSATTADSAVRLARDLVGTVANSKAVPRGGVAYGDLVNLHGDYFGPVVNLAARLVGEAVPREVLVDGATAAGTSVATEPAGRRMLQGFDDPVPVFSVS